MSAVSTPAADLRPFPLAGFTLSGSSFAVILRWWDCARRERVPREFAQAVLRKAQAGSHADLVETLAPWAEVAR